MSDSKETVRCILSRSEEVESKIQPGARTSPFHPTGTHNMPDPDRLLTTLRRAAQACRTTPGRRGRTVHLNEAAEVLATGVAVEEEHGPVGVVSEYDQKNERGVQEVAMDVLDHQRDPVHLSERAIGDGVGAGLHVHGAVVRRGAAQAHVVHGGIGAAAQR